MTARHPALLYVEDEADDVFFMRQAFVRVGVEMDVRIASDGAQAMAYLGGAGSFGDRTLHPVPSLVLLDLNLPLRSGFEVLEWMRGRAELSALPVVIFSSSGRPEDRERAGRLGATDYLLKPSSGLQFDAVVRELCARRYLPAARAGDAGWGAPHSLARSHRV